MAHLTADRVRETTTTTGTGAITLAGAVVGFRAFSSVLSIGDTCYYSIASLPGSEWEVGIGTYSALNTLTRTTVLSSSNAGAAVTFSAGTKEIFITAAASRFLQADNTGSYGNFTAGTITAALTGNASTATTLQTSRTIWGQSFNGSANITGVLLAPNGSVTAPALSFVNDTNTGLYTDGSDTLYITTAGTNAAYFDPDGDATFVKQVSIGGTQSPLSGPVTALGTLVGGGTGYMNGTHNTVALTGGTGSGVRATVTVALGVVTGITLSWGGRTYLAGETLSVPSLATTLATTAASGDGTTATITFAAQPAAPFEVGSQIIVAGVTPTGYNATATVTACTTTSVSYLNATTGAQTVAGTVKMGTPLTTSTIPISTVNQVSLYLASASYPRIRLESTNTAVVAGSELGTLYFSSRDISANASGDTTFIRGVGVGTSGGGELQFFTSANGGTPNIAATISSANTLRLYNSAGTFYSDISSAATANRTVTLPDGNVTLATGTMAITGGKLSQFAATTSTELAGVISDETGSGSLVFANTPTLVTPNIGAATGTSLTTTGIVTGSGGIRSSDTSFPTYQILLDFGADLTGTWRKIITATLSAGTQYSTHGFRIRITDPNANHATQGSVNVDEVVYYVACVRTESTTIDTPDLCVVRGPASHVQAVKLATGSYEIQVQPEGQYREYLITIDSYATNGAHTIVYSNGSTAGSAGIATYSASAGGATTWVDKLQSTGNITTNAELVSQGSSARFSLYRSDGINYFDWSSGQSLYLSTQTSAGGAGRSTKAIIDTSGNIGINYTPIASTTSKLQLAGDISLLAAGANTLHFNSYYTTAWKARNAGFSGAIRFDDAQGSIQFWTSPASVAADANSNIANTMSLTAAGNLTATSFNSITGLSSTTPLVAGTAAVGTGTTVARADHVHPAQTTVSGNAGTASAWQTARTLTIGATGKSVDGSANVSWTRAEVVGAVPSSGDWFSGGAPEVRTDGVMEIGRYIDFHNADAGTSDFDVRIDCTAANAITFGGSTAVTAGSFNSITGLASAAPLVAGTAAVGTGTTVARADHVHPAQTTVSGNAGTVTNGVYTTDQVVTARATTVSTNSGDWNSQVTAGSYNVSGNGTWTGSTNGPTDAYPYGQLLVYVNGNIVTQHYFAHSTTGNYIRTKFNASDWQAWQETWTNLNDGSGSGLDADLLDGRHLDTLTANLRANRAITGGGTITFDASSNLLWSSRFIVISNGRGAHFSTNGYFDINCPTTGTVTGVGGAANVTATAAGIPIGSWQALYYILPIGSANTSVAANFRIASYTADVTIPDEWLLIAVRNGDTGQAIYLHNGYRLEPGESIDTATYDAKNADLLDGNNASAFALSGHNHTYNVNDPWLRDNGDDAHVKLYGNTRQMAFRTDGTTEYATGIGAYPFAWTYGGDASGNRVMLVNTSGDLWTSTNGWLSTALAGKQASGSYLTAEADTLATVTGRGFTTRASSGAFATNTQGTPGLEIYGGGSTEPAYMTFHRPSQYAVRFGLDGSDLKVGGWSLGNVAYTMLHSNNYNSYSPTLTGTGASGTWAIGVTGNVNSTSVEGSYLGVNNTSNTTGYGLSLYGGSTAGAPTYGIMFAGTGTWGTHGSVTETWATYFTTSNTTNRGWIFKAGTGSAGNIASINNAGTAVFNGNVTAYSDIRLKTDIRIIEDAVNKVKKLRGVTYDRTDTVDIGRQTGVIAQEVLEVLPEAVLGSEETTYSVAYGNMVGLLIEAIKEQQNIIDSQEERINKLEKMINRLIEE